MKSRLIMKVGLAAFTAGLLVGLTPGAANAAVIFGNYLTWTTSGTGYKGRAGVNQGAGTYADGQVATQSGASVPAGYLGASATLYKQNASGLFDTCTNALVVYSGSATSIFNRFTNGACGAGNYRAGTFSYTYNTTTGLTDVHAPVYTQPQAGS